MSSTANPILSTVETVKGYPATLKLFKCAESRYWQVSAYLASRLVRKSTRTEEKAIAVRFAKAFYNDLLLKQAQNIPLTQSPSFEIVAVDLFKEDQGRVDRGERKQSLVDDSKYIYEADLLKFFHRNHVKDITYQRLNDYIKYLKKSREDADKEPIKSKTLKNHFIVLSKILKHAHKLGYIDRLPVFPTIIAKDNPREWFSDEQYQHLLKITDQATGTKVRFLPITIELRYLIEFTANSYLRPPDIKTLKNKQVLKIKNYLRIAAISKVKASPVITQPVAADVYEKLLRLHSDAKTPEDYVFFPEYKNRDYAMSSMNRQFNHVLVLAGLKEGPNGAKRTLYSLRHTCIMNTLLKAKHMDLLTLARNCRTSVEMLERYYASALQPEMNVDKFQLTKDAAPTEPEFNLDNIFQQLEMEN